MNQPDAAAMTVTTDVSYGEAGGTPLLLDFYHRDADGPADDERAAIVLIHGGGWFRGDKSKEPPLAATLVEAGYLVAVPDYREAPQHTFPASRDDVLTAYRWLLASEQRFDRGRVAFFGGSAGGNLSVEAGLATGRPAVSWSGIFDLAGIVAATDGTIAEPTQQDLDAMKSADINQTGPDDAFLRFTVLQEVGGDRSLLAEASTTGHATAAAGPVYLANSLNEFVPVRDPQAMQQALSAVGVASTLQLVPGTHHAEGYTPAAIGQTLAFLADVLAPAPAP
ncbi:alpha/beta hydrolase [Herbiconiux sp. VKM Ac-1786]|uniref:alpha/beta hydrolase n=1 Tax=Herbiconiux sp. VKM Ac-1786 TaxID=2783824 RepID=UPI001889CE7D|nr:alpha/beta hydrolase [Herbiconiux sp. VKM Ac-1786]MBF4574286.1 alpha/beta hydrolase [Herbiconiux sp. VKM Ac-1786]